MPPRSMTSHPQCSQIWATIFLASASLPPMNMSGGPPGRSGWTKRALPTVLKALTTRAIPAARVVKAFNTVGNALFVHPDLPGGPPDMFIGGNDADAKKIVAQICEHWGWDVIDLGGIESSRYLEPMCLVWVL